jgi:hypothetical protein
MEHDGTELVRYIEKRVEPLMSEFFTNFVLIGTPIDYEPQDGTFFFGAGDLRDHIRKCDQAKQFFEKKLAEQEEKKG